MEEKQRKETQPVRRITQAPPPVDYLSGRGDWPSARPKPTQMPLDWPPYYPSHLEPRTTVIIGKALKKFPDQTQTLQLCKHVVSKLTPHFCAAVQDKRLESGAWALSCMSDLLHYLLVANCDDSSSHTESDKRFRLERELKKSDEWVRLARGLIEPAEAQEAKIEAARKLISQAEQLSASEKVDFGNAVADLAKESPRTAVAVEKLKQYSAKAGKAIGEGVWKIVLDVASEAAKKILLPGS